MWFWGQILTDLLPITSDQTHFKSFSASGMRSGCLRLGHGVHLHRYVIGKPFQFVFRYAFWLLAPPVRDFERFAAILPALLMERHRCLTHEACNVVIALICIGRDSGCRYECEDCHVLEDDHCCRSRRFRGELTSRSWVRKKR